MLCGQLEDALGVGVCIADLNDFGGHIRAVSLLALPAPGAEPSIGRQPAWSATYRNTVRCGAPGGACAATTVSARRREVANLRAPQQEPLQNAGAVPSLGRALQAPVREWPTCDRIAGGCHHAKMQRSIAIWLREGVTLLSEPGVGYETKAGARGETPRVPARRAEPPDPCPRHHTAPPGQGGLVLSRPQMLPAARQRLRDDSPDDRTPYLSPWSAFMPCRRTGLPDRPRPGTRRDHRGLRDARPPAHRGRGPTAVTRSRRGSRRQCRAPPLV
jgi:hypothetical protein